MWPPLPPPRRWALVDKCADCVISWRQQALMLWNKACVYYSLLHSSWEVTSFSEIRWIIVVWLSVCGSDELLLFGCLCVEALSHHAPIQLGRIEISRALIYWRYIEWTSFILLFWTDSSTVTASWLPECCNFPLSWQSLVISVGSFNGNLAWRVLSQS